MEERWRLTRALKEKVRLGSRRGVSKVEGTDNANPPEQERPWEGAEGGSAELGPKAQPGGWKNHS